ncbi:MAG: hypothetical protein J7M34_13785 [Anaerolineae bacterium]|nr:hypothetical protein [Anaerolineae bacterium]
MVDTDEHKNADDADVRRSSRIIPILPFHLRRSASSASSAFTDPIFEADAMSSLHADKNENRRRRSTAKATTLLIGSFCVTSVHPFYITEQLSDNESLTKQRMRVRL